MSGDIAAARRSRETRQTLRELDSARRAVKLAKHLLTLSIAVLGAVIAGWVFALRWGLSSVGHVDRGGPMAGMLFGLIIVSVLTVGGVGLAIAFLSEMADERDKAHGKWEDATWAEVES